MLFLSFQTFIGNSQVATILAMHYTLQVAKAKDKIGVTRVLGYLANAVHLHPFEDAFMHCLVTHLIQVRTKEKFALTF